MSRKLSINQGNSIFLFVLQDNTKILQCYKHVLYAEFFFVKICENSVQFMWCNDEKIITKNWIIEWNTFIETWLMSRAQLDKMHDIRNEYCWRVLAEVEVVDGFKHSLYWRLTVRLVEYCL